MKEPDRLSKIIGCFLGASIGNALGMPWKTMSFKEIMLATRRLGVSGFSDPVQLSIMDMRNLEPGQPAGNWQLTRAVARSLIAYNGFNLFDVIKEHLSEFEKSDIGFDSSTRDNLRAILALAKGDWKTNPNFRLPRAEELQHQGSSNGVAIKISPLAIFFRNRHDDFFDATIKLASITHRDPQAMISAYALGIMINRLYSQSIGFNGKEQLRNEVNQLIQEIITETLSIEYSLLGGNTQFSVQLLEVGRLVKNGKIADIDSVRERIGTGCFCAESIPFSMAMFLRRPTDFRGAVIETINCGGDTDSNASMVGALIGTNLGAMAIPEEWRTFREEYKEAGDLALTLHNVMYDKK